MYCSNCGEQNIPGAKFCRKCGSPLEQTESGKDESYKATPNPTENSDNYGKRKNGLLIAFGIVGALIAATAIVLLLIGSNECIEGSWYNTALGQVLVFREDSEIIIRTPYGSYVGTYKYDDENSNGIIVSEGVAFMFDYDEGSITVFNQSGEENVFLKAGDDMNMEYILSMKNESPEPNVEISDEASSEPSPSETSELQETPASTTETESTAVPSPTFTAEITPTPTITATPSATPTMIPTFSFNVSFMPIITDLVIIDPDIFYYDVLGKWYSVGSNSEYEFFNDNTYSYDLDGFGISYTYGTYTYDNASDTGTMQPDFWAITVPFSVDVDNEILVISGHEYSRD